MASILDRYKSVEIRHPSWRIYKAIETIHESIKARGEEPIDLTPNDFGLKDDASIYYPYKDNDDLTNELVKAILDPEYTDGPYFKITDCMRLFLDVKARQSIEASLMENQLAVDISVALGVDTVLIETYSACFFDTSVWRSPADKLAYLRKGIVGEDAHIKNLVSEKGLAYVQTEILGMPKTVKLDEALAVISGKVYVEALRNMKSDDPIDQKNSQIWVARFFESYDRLKNSAKADGGIRELTIALETSKAPTVSIGDLN